MSLEMGNVSYEGVVPCDRPRSHINDHAYIMTRNDYWNYVQVAISEAPICFVCVTQLLPHSLLLVGWVKWIAIIRNHTYLIVHGWFKDSYTFCCAMAHILWH